MPSAAVAIPVTATTPTSTSLARASRRSGGESRLSAASSRRAPTQPAVTASSESELIAP